MNPARQYLQLSLCLAVATLVLLAYALAQGPSDTDTERALADLMHANAEVDAAFERMDAAGAALCQAEQGPGSTHVWTADQELVCYPAASPSWPLQGDVKLASSI